MNPSETSRGRDLATILRGRGALTVGEAARVCADAARMLERSIHGDVRPENLALSTAGEFTLVGARANSIGNADYRAPERWDGAPASASADLYALGATLFQLIAGRPPFRRSDEPADEATLADRHLRVPPPDLQTEVSGVEPAVADLCRRLLEKSAAKRPSHAEVVAALDRVAADLAASLPRVEAYGSRGGRTAFMAARPRTAFLSAATREAPGLRAIRWAIALAIFVVAIVCLWVVLP